MLRAKAKYEVGKDDMAGESGEFGESDSRLVKANIISLESRLVNKPTKVGNFKRLMLPTMWPDVPFQVLSRRLCYLEDCRTCGGSYQGARWLIRRARAL